MSFNLATRKNTVKRERFEKITKIATWLDFSGSLPPSLRFAPSPGTSATKGDAKNEALFQQPFLE
jgi:hypothetical protein